jgi:hypothetical protein
MYPNIGTEFIFWENTMDRVEYYDRLLKRVVIYGVTAGFLVMNIIAICFIK